MTAQELFNENYLFLRHMVVRGVCGLGGAKLWVREHGERTITAALVEKYKDLPATMGTRVERDFDCIEEEDEEEDE